MFSSKLQLPSRQPSVSESNDTHDRLGKSDSVTVIYRHVVYCLICLAAEKWSVAYILKHTQLGLSALVD